MNLPAGGDPHERSVEAVYQAAKCYGNGGPDTHAVPIRVRSEAPRPGAAPARPAGGIPARRQAVAAGDRVRLLRLAVDPQRAALHCGHGVVERLQRYEGFTDQFHRPGAVACQAKTAAIVAGMGLSRARAAIETPEAWLRHMSRQDRPLPRRCRRRCRRLRRAASTSGSAHGRRRRRSSTRWSASAGRWPATAGRSARERPTAPTRRSKPARSTRGVPREIWLPWPGFNGRTADGATTRVGTNNQANRDLARQSHPAWHVLRDAVQKLMVRNVHQILGPEPGSSPPSDMVICWTPDGAGEGGTGMAIRLAERHGIPVVDLGTRELPRLERSLDAARGRGMPADVAAIVLEGLARPGAGAGARRRALPRPGDREPESRRGADPRSPPRRDRREQRSRRSDRRAAEAHPGRRWPGRTATATRRWPRRRATPAETAGRDRSNTPRECSGRNPAPSSSAAESGTHTTRPCGTAPRSPTSARSAAATSSARRPASNTACARTRRKRGPQAGRAEHRRPDTRAPSAGPLRRRRPARVRQAAVD